MQREFEDLTRRLSQAVFDYVTSGMNGKNWISATLDVRYDPSGHSWNSKIRVTSDDGPPESLDMTNDIDVLLISLNSHRRDLGDEWYGLLLTMQADQHCKIKLNYDSRCSEDASFFNN
ncbi:MAG: hypothetical protein SGJ19_17495 [Planctomycetia bacterium]|nr:hypothetical protein [Planctomycetia bacterium]